MIAFFKTMSVITQVCLPAVFIFFFSCKEPAASPAPAAKKDTVAIIPLPAGKPDSTYKQEARLIVPGTGIGVTLLGENADSLMARLGKPDRTDAAMGKAWLIWTSGHEPNQSHETAVFTARNMGVGKEESRVQVIRVTSSFFHTADSLQTGTSLQKIKQKMPGLQQIKTAPSSKGSAIALYENTALGISFEMNASGICTAILVHKTNKPVQVYLPLQP